MRIPSRSERTAWVDDHPMRAIIGCVFGGTGVLLDCLAAYHQHLAAVALGACMIAVALLVGWRFWLCRIF